MLWATHCYRSLQRLTKYWGTFYSQDAIAILTLVAQEALVMPRAKPPVQREELATILKIVCARLELPDSFQEKWLQACTFRVEMPKEASDLANDAPRNAKVRIGDLKEALLNWRYGRRYYKEEGGVSSSSCGQDRCWL